MGTVHRFVAPGAPASSAREERGVVPATDKDFAGCELLLKVALQAEVLVALDKHSVIDRAVRVVTGGAAFADGFVLEHEGTPLCNMAGAASLTLGC